MRDDKPLSKYESLDRLGRALEVAAESESRPRKGLRSRSRGILLVAAVVLGLAGGGAAVAGLAELFRAPSPEELATGPADGALEPFCEQEPCSFITTDPSLDSQGSEALKPDGTTTPLSECSGAAGVLRSKGYYLPSFGGFEGPCPTPAQLSEIKPYTDVDALRDQLALDAIDRKQGEQPDPALLEALERAKRNSQANR